VGILYILAHCNGERSGREWEEELEQQSSWQTEEEQGYLSWMRGMLPGGRSKVNRAHVNREHTHAWMRGMLPGGCSKVRRMGAGARGRV